MNMTIKDIPKAVHSKLTAHAKAHGRSLNKEIITILQERVLPQPTPKEELLERIRQRRAKLNIRVTQKEIQKMIDEGRA